jgi:hypothetical protein
VVLFVWLEDAYFDVDGYLNFLAVGLAKSEQKENQQTSINIHTKTLKETITPQNRTTTSGRHQHTSIKSDQRKPGIRREGDNLAFVIGNGRTGTNWLGSILLSHSNVTGANERQPEFSLVTNLALRIPLLDSKQYSQQLNKVINQYRSRSESTRTQTRMLYHSDKSHPSIWFAQDLLRNFPGAKFLGIERCVYPTVASCVRHHGVSAWFRHQDLLSTPNAFLGITQSNLQMFPVFPLHVQCALRWASHQQQYQHLVPTLRDSFFLTDYRQLALHQTEELQRLQDFLGLAAPFHQPPVPHYDPIKWKTSITHQQRIQIDEELEQSGWPQSFVQKYCHPSEL